MVGGGGFGIVSDAHFSPEPRLAFVGISRGSCRRFHLVAAPSSFVGKGTGRAMVLQFD